MHILLDIADITARVALALAMAFRDDPEPPAPPEPPPAPAPAPEPEPMPAAPSCNSFTFPQTSFASQPVGLPVPTRPVPFTQPYVPQVAPVFRPVYPQPIYRAPVYSQPVIPYRHVPFGQPFSQAPVRYTQPAVLPSAPRTTMRTANC